MLFRVFRTSHSCEYADHDNPVEIAPYLVPPCEGAYRADLEFRDQWLATNVAPRWVINVSSPKTLVRLMAITGKIVLHKPGNTVHSDVLPAIEIYDDRRE